MDTHSLHTLTGIAILVFMAIKVGLHAFLDTQHSRWSGWITLFIAPLPFILPYRSDVRDGYRTLKAVCNACILLTVIALLLNIIAGLPV